MTMLNFIDNLLNRITMYRLVLYFLIFLLIIATTLSFLNLLPYSSLAIILSTLFILFVCWITNIIFAKFFDATTNVESVYITALILALIITPMLSIADLGFFSLASWASVWAIASKYVFAVRRKHIFNPAAFGVALTALTINQSASWWVGTAYLLPFVVIGGLLIVKKIRRFDLFLSFIVVSLIAITVPHIFTGGGLWPVLYAAVINSPVVFFATVMLTEPLTTPPRRAGRASYGGLVGFLFSPSIHLGGIYSTPELSLLAGNIFSYLISPKDKFVLKFKEKIKVASGVYDFLFKTEVPMVFLPGQYLEWTLGQAKSDSRGNRRYFTIASSPTEKDLRLGIKFYNNPSSFKKDMLFMNKSTSIVASQLAGDFVMPKDKSKKLVFIAGGIGVTPFRSMVKYLLDKNERRSITIFYSNRSASDIAYRETFEKAKIQLGINVVYTLTDNNNIPSDWRGERGLVDNEMIAKYVPDFRERIFYLSGPRSMVTVFDRKLKELGVSRFKIKKDYFPGFA